MSNDFTLQLDKTIQIVKKKIPNVSEDAIIEAVRQYLLNKKSKHNSVQDPYYQFNQKR